MWKILKYMLKQLFIRKLIFRLSQTNDLGQFITLIESILSAQMKFRGNIFEKTHVL